MENPEKITDIEINISNVNIVNVSRNGIYVDHRITEDVINQLSQLLEYLKEVEKAKSYVC